MDYLTPQVGEMPSAKSKTVVRCVKFGQIVNS